MMVPTNAAVFFCAKPRESGQRMVKYRQASLEIKIGIRIAGG